MLITFVKKNFYSVSDNYFYLFFFFYFFLITTFNMNYNLMTDFQTIAQW